MPERIGNLARLAATFRAQVNALIVDPARRRTFWRRLVEGPAARLVLAGDDAGARRTALGELDDARRRLAPVGIAHIVGAGPGDPDLLTLKAAQLLREADAILHDDLVPPAVLARARRDAELVAVGKRKGQVRWTQDEINAELVRRVRAGQTVVRLKAGDPFMFGRGGEEVEALREAACRSRSCRASRRRWAARRRSAFRSPIASSPRPSPSSRATALKAAARRHGRRWPRRAIRSPSTWAPRRQPPCAIVCCAPAPIPRRRSPSSRTARGPTNGFPPVGSPTWRGSPPPIPAAMPAPASSSSARWPHWPLPIS